MHNLWEWLQSVWAVAALRGAMVFRRQAFMHGTMFGIFLVCFALYAAGTWLPVSNEVVASAAASFIEYWIVAWPIATLVMALYLLLTSPRLLKEWFASPALKDTE